MANKNYIAALDIGTTNLRCQIIDCQLQIIGSSISRIQLLYPQSGYVEIDPEQLWESTIQTMKDAIKNANLSVNNINCIGISTQRSTFTSWNKKTGKSFHNLITWKDLRANSLCKDLNKSVLLKTIRSSAYLMYLFTRNKRYLTGSRLEITTNHVTGRLLWAIDNFNDLKNALTENEVMFGTIDTWLLYKFSNKSLHLTDISNASATGFFDPFTLEWGLWAKIFLKIPFEILPTVVSNDFDFGYTDESIFGIPIPIKCVMSDQSSSMIASSCFKKNDLNITLGTGAFLDINTGDSLHTTLTGIYPLIGWKLNNNIVYLTEGSCNDCSSLIEWMLKNDFIKQPADTAAMAKNIQNSDDVFFVTTFSGLETPINKNTATSAFIGIKPTTTKNHLVRAILESILYRIVLLYDFLKDERQFDYRKITVGGGVSKNDFVCQLLADLTETNVERLINTELSAIGVGFIAGLNFGIWKNINDIKILNKTEKIFKPNCNTMYKKECKDNLKKWLEAQEKFKYWYK